MKYDTTPPPALRRYHLAAAALVLAMFVFRLHDVGDNPRAFFCDEAAFGYNARSIVETGRDEHGLRYPVYFRSFGDHKGFPYVYACALTTAAFGPSHFSTRLPAAILLGLVPWLVYLILARTVHPGCGLIGAAMIGAEPWLHHWSHLAAGPSAVPLFLALAVYGWVRAMAGRPGWFLVSATGFTLAFYSYPPARVAVPLLAAALLLLHRRPLLADRGMRRGAAAFVGLGLLTSFPFWHYLLFVDRFLERVRYLTIFSTPYLTYSSGYKWYQAHLAPLLGSADTPLLESVPTTLLRGMIVVWNYVSHFSPEYLFLHADRNLRLGSPQFGVFGYLTAVGLVAGLVLIVRRRAPLDKFLLCWLAVHAIPGSLVWEDVPSSARGMVLHPAVNLIAAAGIWWIAGRLRAMRSWSRSALAAFVLLAATLYGVHAARYLTYHARDYSREANRWLQFGFDQMMDYIRDHHGNYDEVVIVSTKLHYEPYIFALYYSERSPREWQRTRTLPWNIRVRTSKLGTNDLRENVLYVLAPIPPDLDPGLRKLGAVRWEDDEGDAFGYFVYERRGS